MSAPIEFRDVYRHFDKKDVLNGLSFQVEKGQVFAPLDCNGTGDARVFAKSSLTLPPAEDQRRIAYVSEGHRLYELMRVRAQPECSSGPPAKR